jgi:hypothetical protein
MAKRYSGLATVTLTYDDRRGDYKASVSVGGHSVWSGRVGAPRSGGGAVDSPKAYDDTAHAAISFAVDEHPDLADGVVEYDRDGYGWHISRSPAKRSVRHVNPGRRPARKGPRSRKTPNPGRKARAKRKTARRPKAKRKANGQFARKARRR